MTVRDRKAYLVANLKPEKAPFTSACAANTIRLDVELELSGDGSAASVSKGFYLIEQQPSASPPCEALVMIPLYQSFGGLQVAPAVTTHGGLGGRWETTSVNGFGAAVTCSVELNQGSLNVDCPGRAYKAELKVGPVRISGTDTDGVEILAQR